MNTIEKSKLIEGGNLINNFYRELKGYCFLPMTDGLALKSFRDWNSLMTIIEMIERIEIYPFRKLFNCDFDDKDSVKGTFDLYRSKEMTVIRASWDYWQTDRPVDGLSEHFTHESSFENTYDAVVEFIKWYNENKSK